MENIEILNALAHSVAQIVDEEVEKRTEDTVNLRTLINELKNGSLAEKDAKELFDAIMSGYGEVDAVVGKPTTTDITPSAVIDALHNPDSEMTFEDLLDELSTEEEVDLKEYIRGMDFVEKDDMDEDWIFDNLDNSTIRDVAKRYIDENL